MTGHLAIPATTLGARLRVAASRWVLSTARQWRAVCALTVLWMALWGQLSWANAVGGVMVSVVVIRVFPLPVITTPVTVRPWPLVCLAARFMVDLCVAATQVAALALHLGRVPRSGVVEVRLRLNDDLFLTAVSVLTSLVPGSVVIGVRRQARTLVLHVLDMDPVTGRDAVRRRTQDLEARVLRAFAPGDPWNRSPDAADSPGAAGDGGENRSTSGDAP